LPPIAAIDIGTNTVLLAIARQPPAGGLEALFESARITRLGQGVADSGRLAPEAIARTLEALRACAAELERLGVGWRGAIGTSALREATNAGEFLEPAQKILGCPVEVISGRREAQLTLAGVRGSLGELPAGSLLFDVGGGSTELIRCQDRGGEPRLASLELGSVRLTEAWLPDDPPSPGQVPRLREHLRRELAARPLLDRAGPLVGIAGTVTTLATVELGLEVYDTHRVNGLRLTRHQVEAQVRRFAAVDLAARRRIAGLEPARADIILAGALIVASVLERCGAADFRACDRGVRWGLLWERVG
jgi:exopolyphosphatase/guanosine-5'-triphosphate,3'-diphosphate pyrophosphatase